MRRCNAWEHRAALSPPLTVPSLPQRITVEKEQAMDTMVMSLQKKLRKLEKQTRLQKEKEV